MKILRSFVPYIIMLSFSWAPIVIAQNKKADPRLFEKAQRDGVVRVIVSLNVTVKPEGELDQRSVQAQRNAIAMAQNKLSGELLGRKYKEIRRFITVPGLALE